MIYVYAPRSLLFTQENISQNFFTLKAIFYKYIYIYLLLRFKMPLINIEFGVLSSINKLARFEIRKNSRKSLIDIYNHVLHILKIITKYRRRKNRRKRNHKKKLILILLLSSFAFVSYMMMLMIRKFEIQNIMRIL